MIVSVMIELKLICRMAYGERSKESALRLREGIQAPDIHRLIVVFLLPVQRNNCMDAKH